MSRYPEPGTTLVGKYLVDALVGEGGMGVVLKAKHLDLDEPVAIKVLLPEMMERKDIESRFIREAKAAVKLKGEHVARVIDVGRLENRVPYIVMEYLEGADLNAIIKHHGAQDPQVAVDLVLQACEAIAEAHSMGIIHRDIKASNFFITQPPGTVPMLKVLDFGIATAPEGTSDLTSTQSVIGTPAYMAPEQMRSSRNSDVRSDIWSMGVVLYELLEGARPFRSEVYSDLCLKVGMDPPEPFQRAIPEGLQAIVLRCLEKTVERRYQSVAELAFDLMPYATDPIIARATVEQCARLLGRRSTRAFDKVPRSYDATPLAFTPSATPSGAARPTPIPNVPADGTLDEDEEAPTALAQPRDQLVPVPREPGPRTPTSIRLSTGELTPPPEVRPRRRGLVIGAVAVAAIAIGGVGLYAMTNHNGKVNAQASAPVTDPAPSDTAKPNEPAMPTSTEPAMPTSTAPGGGSSAAPPAPPAPKVDDVKTDPKAEPPATKPEAVKTTTPPPVVKKTTPPPPPVVKKTTPPVVKKTTPPATSTTPPPAKPDDIDYSKRR